MRTTAEIAEWRERNPNEQLSLRGASMVNSKLSGADLHKADLRGASLVHANLSYCNLDGADLSGADLSYCNLSNADLESAWLSGANLTKANMTMADLGNANLRGANLCFSNLRGANLEYAILRGAYLTEATGIYLPRMIDIRGYIPYSQVCNGLVMFGSGCRYFTLEQAKAYWGAAYQGMREIGDAYVRAIKEMEASRAFRQWVRYEMEKDNAT